MLLKSMLLLVFASMADSVPPDECEAILNHSDCGLKPTVVYTNFSPMALCHPAIWRGCPTKNKFVSEYQCQEFCIARKAVKKDHCDVPMNTTRCVNHTKEVYTFSLEKRTCVKANWHGCPTENMFNNQSSCMNSCQMEWVDKLAIMDISEVRQTSKLLNELIKRVDDPRKIRYEPGKKTNEYSNAKAYFIQKLQKVNKELDRRLDDDSYTKMMLIDEM